MQAIQHSLGYDEFGNNPDLLTRADKRNLDRGRIARVSGDATCPACGEAYRLHPPVQGALWATRGCFGLVKL
ncbi:hypothetical protein SAMN04488498_104353 [Mesorhizobium albiziae]|uniref:Uncharacterized protein n=1 Tax=Neomesorhizobium albiziae TaxID=335020 RepID=A0A1I3YEH3_9HYPH|nr:hypothetical protein [Mesorhizobium albiziae]GLS29942.1 hypothetical protein GCM10007937_16500 [Mesorhizobium albiziae]SFK29681.1 hypothetical protein SAMN04488498_104353 [Mesorhizobium albiziae]